MRRLALICAVLIASVGLGAVAPPASAAKPAVRITVAPHRVAVGDRLSVTARIAHGAKGQRATLQIRTRGWHTLATKKVKRNGASRLRFAVTAHLVGTFDVRVRLARHGRVRAAVSRPKVVRMIDDTSSSPGSGTGSGWDPGAGSGGDTGGDTGGWTDVNGGVDTATGSFRAVYAVASDQTPTSGHLAAIAAEADVVDGWFLTQTTPRVQPRWVRTDTGEVAVDQVTLPRTTAQIATLDFEDLVPLLSAAAALQPHQKLVVFMDVPTGDTDCGTTGSNISFIGEATCGLHPDDEAFPYGASYVMAHEMTHNFGAVPSCAPHYDGTGHVDDDPRDVLYQGSQPRDWADITLDPGHDDYYDTPSTSCPDIQDSGFWEPVA